MHLKNNEKETASNQNICKVLIEKWSRPIFGISSHQKEPNPPEFIPQEAPELPERRTRKLLEEKTKEYAF